MKDKDQEKLLNALIEAFKAHLNDTYANPDKVMNVIATFSSIAILDSAVMIKQGNVELTDVDLQDVFKVGFDMYMSKMQEARSAATNKGVLQ